MSAFTPCKGDLFYIRLKPTKRVIGDSMFGGGLAEARVIDQQDNSYSDEVFECTGRDDYAVIGKTRHGSAYRGDKPVTFVQARCVFAPVGPEVVEALGIGQDFPAPGATQADPANPSNSARTP